MADDQEAIPTDDFHEIKLIEPADADPEALDVENAEQPDEEKPEGEDKPEEPLRDDKGKFKGRDQARFDELTRRRHEAERRATAAEAEVARLKGSPTPSGEQAQPVAKPSPNDFEDYGDYVEALTDWKVTERTRTNATENAKQASQDAATARSEVWSAKVAEAAAEIPEWNEVVGKSEILIAPHVADAVQDGDPRVMLHLAKNPDVAARLNELSPREVMREMGKIEAKLDQPAPVQEKRQSQAPAPITPIASRSTMAKDPSKMSMDEYTAYRKEQGIR